MSQSAIRFENVSRRFERPGGTSRNALSGVTAELRDGETVAVIGRSGSGKSTLLHLAAAIDRPSEGRVMILGQDPEGMSERDRTLLRRNHIGLVFQFFHLLPHLSVGENIAMPHWIAGRSGGEVRRRVAELLDRVGLADRAGDPVDRLSGGEKQRVAICRALVRDPKLLLADEPTGSLDDENGRQVMDLLFELVHERHASLLFVTHSTELAARADSRWHLSSGELVAA